MFLKPKQSRSPWPFKLPRRVVRHFAGLMEKVLRDNDWKGGWKPGQAGVDSNTIDFFREKLWEEYGELQDLLKALNHGEPVDPKQIAREAADVANIAMMIADNYGSSKEPVRWLHPAQGNGAPFTRVPYVERSGGWVPANGSAPEPQTARENEEWSYKGCE